jgi:hypothetical protein
LYSNLDSCIFVISSTIYFQKMALKNYSLVGVLNTNPSAAANCVLDDGLLTVTAPVGSLAWGGSIKWVDVVSNDVITPSSGQFQAIRFDTSVVTPTVNTQYIVRIYPDPVSGVNPSTFIYNTGAVAPSIATLVTAIAAQITSDSQGTYTASNVANDLVIQGNLGNLGTQVYGFNATINLAVTQTVSQALIQPEGSPSIINANTGIPLSNLTAASYNTYEVLYTEKVENAAGTFEVVNRTAVVYVDNTADSGAGSFNQQWGDNFSGAGTTAEYLARP